MDGEAQARFSGYAVVEIMGHQQAAGWVTTEYFGSAAMLHVVMPAQSGEERVLDHEHWTGREMLAPGSVVRVNRKAVDEWVGAGSVYRLRPCTEEHVRSVQPSTLEVISRAERKALQPAGDFGAEDFEVGPEDDEE